MIRGVLSLVGMGILFVLLVRTVQGEMSLVDVALRGLVIVLVIAVVDKLVVPIVAYALRVTTIQPTEDDGSTGEPLATGETGA